MLKIKTTEEKRENRRYLKRIGNKIRILRKEKKLTQKELATSIGTNYIQIGRIERKGVNSTIIMLRKIAIVLNVNLSEIVDV